MTNPFSRPWELETNRTSTSSPADVVSGKFPQYLPLERVSSAVTSLTSTKSAPQGFANSNLSNFRFTLFPSGAWSFQVQSMLLGYSPGIHGEEMVPGTEALIIWSFPPVQWSVIWPLTAKHQKDNSIKDQLWFSHGEKRVEDFGENHMVFRGERRGDQSSSTESKWSTKENWPGES